MMNGVATGTLVGTSICYRLISSIYIGVSHHLVRDVVVHNWSSHGYGHIDGNCVWWSQRTSRVCTFNQYDFLVLHASCHNQGRWCLGETELPLHKWRENFIDNRNPLHLNTLKLKQVTIGIGPVLLYSQVHLWTAPWSLPTAVLNTFSNNNFKIYFKNSNYPTLIA